MVLYRRKIAKIQFTSGCPNGCAFCYEPKKQSMFYDPEIPKCDLQILDMNFLYNPKAEKILKQLHKGRHELVCGVDYRRLTQNIADLLKQKGFIKVRWAWDYGFSQQKKHRNVLRMFRKAGFRPENLSVFMITNYKIPYVDCVKKLDLLKVWNVKVNDCCFDGGYKNSKPLYWDIDQLKRFRAACRKHNQLVNFKIDPEYI